MATWNLLVKNASFQCALTPRFLIFLFIYLFIFVFQVWRHGPVHIFRSDCRSHMLRGWRHTGRFADTYNSRERHLQETDA